MTVLVHMLHFVYVCCRKYALGLKILFILLCNFGLKYFNSSQYLVNALHAYRCLCWFHAKCISLCPILTNIFSKF